MNASNPLIRLLGWHQAKKIERLERILPGLDFGDAASKDYQTLAGFVVKHLGRVPKEGETFESQDYAFEILDMDRHRVDKVLVMPAKTGGVGLTGSGGGHGQSN